MSAAPIVKGWCPGALRPMESGDGWLVRIRPPGGVLTPVQARGIAQAALAYGNGMLDLSSRANLQLRGVRPEAHGALVSDLTALGLIDADIATESARNIMVSPFWKKDDGHQEIAQALSVALANGQAPDLPGKFGFAIDLDMMPVLRGASADIRIESHLERWLVRADSFITGAMVNSVGGAVDAAMDLAYWFVASGGVQNGRGRMADLWADAPLGFRQARLPALPAVGGQRWGVAPHPKPGVYPEGCLVGLCFGQMRAELLLELAEMGHELRLSPWRMILIAGLQEMPDHPDLITTPDDPLLRVTACTGAPGCTQALGPTRGLARSLAPDVALHLHVSGCAKGCAYPGAADATLVATPDGYNLIQGGKASDPPVVTGLSPDQIAQHLKADHAP